MGEHKRKQGQQGQGPKVARGGLRLVGPHGEELPPRTTLRLVATASEVQLASYLVDFAGSMGIARYRSQTSAIAFVTRVPVAALVNQVVEVCQVPDGFPIAERLQDPRTTPPPLPDVADVARAAAMVAPVPEEAPAPPAAQLPEAPPAAAEG
jgi:hypothetical protein